MVGDRRAADPPPSQHRFQSLLQVMPAGWQEVPLEGCMAKARFHSALLRVGGGLVNVAASSIKDGRIRIVGGPAISRW
jgi:hypothetical protein